MKKNLIIGFMAGAMMAAMAFPSMAATTIDDVYITLTPEEDEEMSPGEKIHNMEPYAEDGSYYVDEYDTSNDDPNPRKSYTYTMDIVAEDGYEFDANTVVHVYGATEVTIRDRDDDVLEVRAKTYPYYVLEEVSNLVINETEEKATWDEVEYADEYDVVIYYTDDDGDERERKRTTSKESIDLSGYIGKYEDVTLSVRAVKGNSEADKFVASSDYMFPDGTVDDEYSPEEYEFNIPRTSSDGSTSNSNNSSSSNNSSNSNGPGASSGTNGWVGSGNTWSYYQNGKKVTGWLGIGSDANGITDEWYLLDSNGNMLSGWQYVDGNWFYLNQQHDGYFGKMLTGWQNINGAWYYLNPSHDGTFGAMYANRTTPDGYYVNANGVWVQ